MDSEFLSTPSARRATEEIPYSKFTVKISIHALREEGDHRPVRFRDCPQNFYPRPPRGGRRTSAARWSASCKFLSTPSARRATLWQLPSRSFARNFYPRPPRGGRPLLAASCCAAFRISIHALREEGDVGGLGLPLRFCISIHALREEGDASLPPLCLPSVYFYPRPPRGGRPSFFSAATSTHQFLSTPSARRATCASWGSIHKIGISIHALREEGDRSWARCA